MNRRSVAAAMPGTINARRLLRGEDRTECATPALLRALPDEAENVARRAAEARRSSFTPTARIATTRDGEKFAAEWRTGPTDRLSGI